MASTFKIVKVPKGYQVVQTRKDYFTSNKPKKVKLETFSTRINAQKAVRDYKKLVS